jgi:hypothetical protein
MNATITKLVDIARHLAAIQLEGVLDYAGFSNADKNVGAHLAHIVAVDPSDFESVQSLASLVAMKYSRQTQALVDDATFQEFRALAKGAKVTPAQREAARNTVVAQGDHHPKFGNRLLLSFQFNSEFAFAIKDNAPGIRAFSGPDGFKWPVRAEYIENVIAALKRVGAKIVGNIDLEDIGAEAHPDRIVHADMLHGATTIQLWTPAFDGPVVNVIKMLPQVERRYNGETRKWTISAFRLNEVIELLEALPGEPVDVCELKALRSSVPVVAAGGERLAISDDEIDLDLDSTTLRDYQKAGVEFLAQPLTPVRSKVDKGASLRGMILGDDMGLGKTMQAIIAADRVAGPNGSVLIIAPATVKTVWKREIAKWLPNPGTVHVVDGQKCKGCKHGSLMHTQGPCIAKIENETGKVIKKEFREVEDAKGDKSIVKINWHYCDCTEAPLGGPSREARWNIINFDIAGDWYSQLETIGYDVMVVDEAHYAKNRESVRSKVIVGGKIPFVHRQDGKDTRDVKAIAVSGLASIARKRVFILSGTPMTNRTRDLFNLLRAVGHPLGKNYKFFADRYCDPEVILGKTGRKFGVAYNGSSNVDELREKIAPIFLQRKAEDYLHELPGRQLQWIAVDVDIKEYVRVMKEYHARREAGELSTSEDHLALLSEARMCAALSKVGATIDRAEAALEEGHKVIIGSVYTRVTDKLIEHFKDRAVAFVGSKSQKEKDAAVDAFQADPKKQVFIGTYTNGQSAATGITLTAGSVVIVNDFDWVPANIKQFYKRADRMGQKKFVNVIFMLAAGTFDEDMAIGLESKLENVNAFEGVSGNLFEDLVERLASAPQNTEVRQVMESRFQGAKAAA